MQISYDFFPETSTQILNYFKTSNYTIEEVKKCGRGVLTILFYVDQKIKKLCLEKVAELKKTYELINKYQGYNLRYHDFLKNGLKTGGNPHLSDALITCKIFDKQTEEDIKEIVRLMPESINCYITDPIGRITTPFPIFIACINKYIPTTIVEFLLENGAKQKFSQTALLTIEYSVPEERYDFIIALLKKYGSISK